MRRRSVGSGLVVAAVLLAASACSVPVADLGGDASQVFGVNDAGVAVGSSAKVGVSGSHAYERLPDDSVVELPDLPGFSTSEARRINDQGQIAGSVSEAGQSRAVRWDADGTVVDLGPGNANDINSDGVVVGQSDQRGFAFDPATGHLVAMPDVPGAIQSDARGINDHGQVVGFEWTEGPSVPVVWDLTTGEVVDLSTRLTHPFFPFEINDAGTMVGMARVDDAPGAEWEAAMVWAGSDEVLPLGGGPFSVAVSLNEANTVVVTRLADPQPYRWQPDTGLVALEGTGHGAFAYDINEAGTIVGASEGKAVFFGVPSSA